MALQVVCPHCGHPNGVGKVFCAACGANMQTGGKPPKIVSDENRGGAPVRLLSLFLKIILIAGPIAILVFMLAPTEPTGRVGKRSQARDYDDALNRIANASRVSGAAFVQVLAEDQLNAKLAAELARQPAATGMAFSIQSLQIDIVENDQDKDRGAITLHMLTTGLNKKINVSYEITVIPRGDPSGMMFEILSARIGHMPLFANLKNFLVGRKFDEALSQMKEEREILSRVRRAQIKKDSLALLIDPKK